MIETGVHESHSTQELDHLSVSYGEMKTEGNETSGLFEPHEYRPKGIKKQAKVAPKETALPGLVPVNISSMYELYIGVKNTTSQNSEFTHDYDGARLSLDMNEQEFTAVKGTTAHSND